MISNTSQYLNILVSVKEEIQSSRCKAALSVNSELILLYWKIGSILLAQDTRGSRFIENLSKDLSKEYPEMKGFSVRNLRYMKKFAQLVPDSRIVQTVSAKLSWSHNIVLLEKVKSPAERMWYGEMAIENGWSVAVLEHHAATGLYARQVASKKIQNFRHQLPSPHSEQVLAVMKDPYIFDFLDLKEDALERDLENQLVQNVTRMLLELGSGFAFVGRQYHLEVGGEDFYLDLLFYHLKLRCYVVIELKTGKFCPEYAGKMNFYLSAVDDLLRGEGDNPSIGLILCRDESQVVAEYALRNLEKPIGISEYKFIQELPKELRGLFPDSEEFTVQCVMPHYTLRRSSQTQNDTP